MTIRTKGNLLTAGIYLFGIVVVILIYWGASFCTDVKGSTELLQRNGYKVIECGGRPFFTEYPLFQTKFKAINSKGDTITGVVAKGWFGKTININSK